MIEDIEVNEFSIEKPIIELIIDSHIKSIDTDIAHIEDELSNRNNLRISDHELTFKTKIGSKINCYKLSLYEQIKQQLINQRKIYYDAFDEDMINDIEYELYHAKVLDNPDHIHNEINPWLSNIYTQIVDARYKILFFQKSCLGENDYKKDISSVENKIAEIQKFTTVDTYFSYPELPHITIQKFVYSLCDEKRMKVAHQPFTPAPIKVIKDIGKIISGKDRAAKEDKTLKLKERNKYRLRARFVHI